MDSYSYSNSTTLHSIYDYNRDDNLDYIVTTKENKPRNSTRRSRHATKRERIHINTKPFVSSITKSILYDTNTNDEDMDGTTMGVGGVGGVGVGMSMEQPLDNGDFNYEARQTHIRNKKMNRDEYQKVTDYIEEMRMTLNDSDFEEWFLEYSEENKWYFRKDVDENIYN